MAWLAAAILPALAACDGTPGRADADDPALVQLGEAVYAVQCASCHGANLEGEPNWRERKPDGVLPAPPHDASGHTWHHPDTANFDYVKKGGAAIALPGLQSAMPGFGETLTDREIWAALAFIKSRWPAPVRERHAAFNERASAR
jgi:mono/diheme cytochrome c family protein